jgi:hypothetical protein
MGLGSLAFVLGGFWMMSSSQSPIIYYEGLAGIARNFKAGKIHFTLRAADGPTPAIALPLSTTTLSSAKAIALLQERYTTKIGQYRISIQEK